MTAVLFTNTHVTLKHHLHKNTSYTVKYSKSNSQHFLTLIIKSWKLFMFCFFKIQNICWKMEIFDKPCGHLGFSWDWDKECWIDPGEDLAAQGEDRVEPVDTCESDWNVDSFLKQYKSILKEVWAVYHLKEKKQFYSFVSFCHCCGDTSVQSATVCFFLVNQAVMLPMWVAGKGQVQKCIPACVYISDKNLCPVSLIDYWSVIITMLQLWPLMLNSW